MPRRTLTKLQIQYLEALVAKEISLIGHVPSTVTEQITLPTLKDLAERLKGGRHD